MQVLPKIPQICSKFDLDFIRKQIASRHKRQVETRMNYISRTHQGTNEPQQYRGKTLADELLPEIGLTQKHSLTIPQQVQTPKKPKKKKLPGEKTKSTERKKVSKAHKYFLPAPGKPDFKTCRGCGNLIKSKDGNTSGLLRHARRCMKVGDDELGSVGRESKKKKPRLDSKLKTDYSSMKKLSLNLVSKSFEEKLVDYLIEDKLLVTALKKTGFMRLIQSQRTPIEHVSVNNLHKIVKARHKGALSRVNQVLQNTKEASSISVYVDSWSSSLVEGYVSIGVQFLTTDFSLKKLILSYTKLDKNLGAEGLASKIFSTLKEFRLLKRIKTITSAGVGDIYEATSILRNKLLQEVDNTINNNNEPSVPSAEDFQLTCMGKMINTLTKELLNAFKHTIEKLKGFVGFWNSSQSLLNSWEDAVVWSLQENGDLLSSLSGVKKEKNNSDRTTLPFFFNKTDWISTLEFLDRFGKKGSLLMNSQNKAQQNVTIPDDFVLEEEDIKISDILAGLLSDFSLFVRISSSEDNVTLSSRKLGFDRLLANLEKSRKELSELNNSDISQKYKTYLSSVDKYLDKLKKIVQEYSDSSLSSLFCQLAYLLDKRFPQNRYHSSKAWEKNYQILVTYLQQLKYTPLPPQSMIRSLDLIKVAQQMQGTPQQEATDIAQEITEFLDLNSVSPQSDILEWWKIHSKKFPRLALAARHILASPSSSCSEEAIKSHEEQKNLDGDIARDETFIQRMELRSWVYL
eukprot:snap_masked-scaffold_40-processed-gene-2.20-mRNA-1 protein AED:1.00 eAED:1.00 QI:0/0/0/0/1/1/2/0/741